MYPLKQSTAITVPFFAHDASGDGVTGMVDGGFTKRTSKNGGAFAAMTVTVSEMENGWYSIPVSASHTDTLGILSLSLSNASCKRVNLQFRVHARLPDDLAWPTTTGRSMDVETDGHVHADLKEWLGVAPSALVAGLVQADAAAISADTAAADALETMLDGTGGNALTATFTGNLTGSVGSVVATVSADMVSISGDGPAADSLEAILDGTGAVMTLSQLRISAAAVGGAVDIDNSTGPGIKVDAGGSSHAVYLIGDGTGSGLQCEAGLTGSGIVSVGGATSGDGLVAISLSGGNGIQATGQGVGDGFIATGGGSGNDIVGDIQGNLSGSVGSVTGTIGGLTAAALADFFDTNSGTTYAASVAGSVVKEIADNAGGGVPPTVGQIADAVWDENIVAAHGGADSAGEILSQLTKRAVTWATEVVSGSIIDQMADDGIASFDRTTDSLQAIADSAPGVDVVSISGDAAAADALEAILDGTGAVMTLTQLRINAAAAGGGIDIDNSAGPAISATTSSPTANGIECQGNTTGHGLKATGGVDGHGVYGLGGATSGDGFRTQAFGAGNGFQAIGGATSGDGFLADAGLNGRGFRAQGHAAGAGFSAEGGATGHGASLVGGATSGNGLRAEAPTASHGAFFFTSGGTGAGLRCLSFGGAGVDFSGSPDIDAIINVDAISGDTIAADNLEAILDGTGAVMTLTQLRINSTAAGGAIDIDNSTGPAISALGDSGVYVEATNAIAGNALELIASGVSGTGIAIAGAGGGSGILSQGGMTGHGAEYRGGGTSGHGFYCRAFANGNGLQIEGAGGGSPFNTDTTDQIEDAIWERATGGFGAGSMGELITALTLDGIADAVWNEDIVTAHGGLGTSGLILSMLVQRGTGGWPGGSNTFLTGVDPTSVIGHMVAKTDIPYTFDRTTDSLEAIRDNMAAGTVDANLVSIDGDLTVGNNATLNLKQLNIVNTTGDAIFAQSSGANGHGMQLVGNGSGNGILALAGTTGRGIDARGGATAITAGEGIRALALGTNQSGLRTEGTGSGAGMVAAAGAAAGSGFVGVGGAGGQAFRADAASGLPLSADIASQISDQNWNEDIVADHGGADSAGLILSQLTSRAVVFNTAVDDTSILGQMADDGIAAFDRTTDSLQAIADSAGGGAPTVPQIADGVWQELLAAHSGIVGSAAEALVAAAAGGGASAAAIAAAVWQTAKADHQGATIMGNIAEDTDNMQVEGRPR